MIVCHCAVVNDRTIRDAIATGATSIDEVTASCRAGARCGGCREAIEHTLAEAVTSVDLAVV